MRLLRAWLVMILLLLTLAACARTAPPPEPSPQPTPIPEPAPAPQPVPAPEPGPPQPAPEPGDAKQQSRRVVEAVMADRIAGRPDLALLWLDAHAKAKDLPVSTAAERMAGYNIWLEEQTGPTYRYRVQILYSYLDRPYSRYTVEFMTVVRNNTTYLVHEVDYYGQREAVSRAKDKELWLKWSGKEKQLLTVADLPDTFTPYGGKDPFGVGKGRFTAVALAPDGKHVAFGSGYTHGFLGLLTVGFDGNEILAAPVLDGLDLYFEGYARELLWSPDGKYLAALVQAPSGSITLHVWDVAGRKRLAVNGFPAVSTPYMVRAPQWELDGRLVFSVQSPGGTTGPLAYSPKSQKVTPP